jgi:hypothetical protein
LIFPELLVERLAKVSVAASKLATAHLLVPITINVPMMFVFLAKTEMVANSPTELVMTTTSAPMMAVTQPPAAQHRL